MDCHSFEGVAPKQFEIVKDKIMMFGDLTYTLIRQLQEELLVDKRSLVGESK